VNWRAAVRRFFRGFAQVFDLSGAGHEVELPPRRPRAASVEDAIRSDWERIRCDLQRAFDRSDGKGPPRK
jgi:hypothetical protein